MHSGSNTTRSHHQTSVPVSTWQQPFRQPVGSIYAAVILAVQWPWQHCGQSHSVHTEQADRTVGCWSCLSWGWYAGKVTFRLIYWKTGVFDLCLFSLLFVFLFVYFVLLRFAGASAFVSIFLHNIGRVTLGLCNLLWNVRYCLYVCIYILYILTAV